MVDRKQLDEIILKNDTNDWWQPERFITHTRELLPTELEVLIPPPAPKKNYNCFIYALGLSDDDELISTVHGFIYDTLIQKLLIDSALERTDAPDSGDYVVYQDTENYPDHLTHMGVLDGDMVVSKWAWGPLIRHNIWDVPASYGNTVFYCKAISPERALALFEQYKKYNIKPV